MLAYTTDCRGIDSGRCIIIQTHFSETKKRVSLGPRNGPKVFSSPNMKEVNNMAENIRDFVLFAALAYGTYALFAAHIGIMVQLYLDRKEKEEH